MKKITRTVVTSTIDYAKVVVKDGKPEFEQQPTLTMFDKCIKDETSALVEVRKAKKDGARYVVTKVATSEAVYGIDFDVFMRYAAPVERPASQQKPAATV